MTQLDMHNPDLTGITPGMDIESPQETQEWESTPEVQEIKYHVPIVQLNTPPAARNGVHFTVALSTTVNNYQLLLGRDYDRVKAYITAVDYPVVIAQSLQQAQSTNNALQGSSSTGSTLAYGSVSDPSTGTTIAATGTLPAGTYSVTVTTLMNGTVTVADVNNTELLVGATVIGTLINGDTTETIYANPAPITVVVPSAGATISTKTIGAGSGTATYNQQIVATPATTTTPPTVLASGQVIPAGTTLPIEHCDEVWVAATSSSLGRVSVEVCRTERASA